MMVRTQQYEVVDARCTAVDPMVHVMRLNVSRAAAARKRAVPIARDDGAA
jgi:hypothetical protein